MVSVFKTYCIFKNKINAITFLSNVNWKMSQEGEFSLSDSPKGWSEIRLVGEGLSTQSLRYYVITPPVRFIVGLEDLVDESTDDHPALIQDNIYKIWLFLNEDLKNDLVNYLTPPVSLDYKKDVDVRFSKEKFFDNKGWLTKVIYYESEVVTINALGIKTVVCNNPILEALFTYSVGTNGYVTHRDSIRKWYKLDGTVGAEITKRKHYDTNEAKIEGDRRRANVQNIMEEQTGRALFLTKGSTLVGGDGTFNTVKQADDYGRPLLNTLETPLTKFRNNGDVGEIVQALQAIDTSLFAWVLGIDPYSGVTIQQLAINIFLNSTVS